MKGFWGVFSFANIFEEENNLQPTKISEYFGKYVYTYDSLHFGISSKTKEEGFYTDEKLIAVGWVRLDNYEELAYKLTVEEKIPDIELIAKAYKQLGIKFLDYILGDFSIFLFDKEKNELLLIKDQLGIRPLFYTVYGHYLIFGTQIDLIKQILPDKPELNQIYIAKELKNYPQEVEDTFFKKIIRLKPAHFLEVKDNQLSEERRYWDLEPVELPKLDGKEAYYELVRSYLIQAIKSRTRGKKVIGCQLSGGMDSSAIAVILSRIFPKEQLHTYSFVLNEHTAQFSDSGIDEKGTQEEIIQYADLIRENHHPVAGFHYRDVFEELETRNKVMGGLANSDSVWQDSLFKQAAEKDKVEVMFSGFPGDEGISCPGGNYYYEYIYHKDLWGLFMHLLKFRRSAIRGFYNYFKFKKLGTTKPNYTSLQETRSTLNPALEKEFNLNDLSFAFKPSFKEWFKSQIIRQHTCLRTESEGSYAIRHGIETVYPLADLRLIQLVYSLPTELFVPKPYSRALFRNVCKGILPDRVRIQPKFSGAKTLAFADFWIKMKAKELKNHQLINSLNLLIKPEAFQQNDSENELMEIKRLNFIKEVDYFIEKNL